MIPGFPHVVWALRSPCWYSGVWVLKALNAIMGGARSGASQYNVGSGNRVVS